MNKSIITTTVILMFTLSACITPEIQAERIIKASIACDAYGFSQGTEAYATCIQYEINAKKARISATLDSIINEPDPIMYCSTFGSLTTCW